MSDVVEKRTPDGSIVQVDFSELTNWIRGTNSRQGKIVRQLDKMGLDMENQIGDKVETISKTGQLHASKYNKVSISIGLENYKVEAGLKKNYAKPAMDEGTAPEDAPSSKELKRWVKLTFGVDGKERDRIAYLVSRKIARSGSKKFREGGPKLFEQAYRELAELGIIVKHMKKIGEYYIED